MRGDMPTFEIYQYMHEYPSHLKQRKLLADSWRADLWWCNEVIFLWRCVWCTSRDIVIFRYLLQTIRVLIAYLCNG